MQMITLLINICNRAAPPGHRPSFAMAACPEFVTGWHIETVTNGIRRCYNGISIYQPRDATSMLKKILALAAASLFSANASASYIEYRLEGGVTGYIIMDASTRAVERYALYDHDNSFTMQEKGDADHRSQVISATTSFRGMGPTNLLLKDEWIGSEWKIGRLMFSEGDAGSPGTFNFVLDSEMASARFGPWPPTRTARVNRSGTAIQSGAADDLADLLDPFDPVVEPINKIVPYFDPVNVPEPASLALLLAGALGIAGVRRHRGGAGM